MLTVVGEYTLTEASLLINRTKKKIQTAILFRYSILYEENFDLPIVKVAKKETILKDRQLLKIQLFLEKFEKNNKFIFFENLLNKKYSKEICKYWEKNIWERTYIKE